MLRYSILICLLVTYEAFATQTTPKQDSHQDGNSNSPKKAESTHGPGGDATGDKAEDDQGSMTMEDLRRDVTMLHGTVQEHHLDKDGKQEQAVEGEEVNPDDESEDDVKDEILEVNYRLPEGKPWKEERYTSDWLYSDKYPVLTAEVHWHCPFYIEEGAKEPENKRRRSDDAECVTTAQLKYWHQHKGSTTDVLLDTYRISYIPTYVLEERNVLKYIVPQKVEQNKVTINVVLRYHSETISCEQYTYEVQDKGQVKITSGEKPKCQKDDEIITKSFKTSEWVWEADDDEEIEDFRYEAQKDEEDADEEEEAHRKNHHEYNYGHDHSHAHGAHDGKENEHDSVDKKPSHKEISEHARNEEAKQGSTTGEHNNGNKKPSHKEVTEHERNEDAKQEINTGERHSSR